MNVMISHPLSCPILDRLQKSDDRGGTDHKQLIYLLTVKMNHSTAVYYIALTDILLIPRIESSLIALTVDMLISLKKNYDSKNRI